MKWRRIPEFLSEKTFLVIKDDLESPIAEAKKESTSIGTWPPKLKKAHCYYQALERPKTANLEKPSILNPRLVDKLDMSLLSKELLDDSTARIQLTNKLRGGNTQRRRQTSFGEQQQCCSVLSTIVVGNARRLKRRSLENSTDSESSHVEVKPIVKKQMCLQTQESVAKKLDDNNNRFKSCARVRDSVPSPQEDKSTSKIPLSTIKRKNSRASPDVEVFTSGPARGAPEPCKTCGRSDQPERFHSHPKGSPGVKVKEPVVKEKPKVSVPKSIQKPVPLNFRSKSSHSRELRVKSSSSLPVTPRDRSMDESCVKRRPKTVTCYICAREFGTASFPIHEPRCIKKWERENEALPPSQRRPVPQRPALSLNHQDWNTVAWEKSQAQLLPCLRCGRTFLPDRLPVHTRSCKATGKIPESERVTEQTTSEKIVSRVGPPTIICQNCGRSFGSKSIKIHEPQCLKRVQSESNALAVNQRKKEPSKNEESVPRESKLTTCYICGRSFGTSSIGIHEPQCLKKWHIENDKLPVNQQRKVPEKPEVIVKSDSETGVDVIDYAAMNEASWRSHLGQLVPCKLCARTFNPDRVEIHERSCKGKR